MSNVDLAARDDASAPANGAAFAIEGAGLAVGVSTYADAQLTSCPAAGRTAEAVARALGPCLSNGVATIVDPKDTYTLFLALQKAVARARGGVFVLYYAGLTIRSGDELLLTTSASRRDGKSACVPWSDVEAILENERVARGLVILNAEGFAGVGWLGASKPGVFGMGSVRIHDPNVADARIASYGAAVADAFGAPAHELREHLVEGKLDVAALGRYLAARAPTPAGYDPLHPKRGEPARHETFGTPDASPLVLRDLRDELARAPARAASTGIATALATTGRSRRGLVLVLLVAAAIVGAIVVALLRR
ncbi:MAG TPA: hypothetical protein VGM56_32550 [Byssovorax sp.]